MAIVYTDDDGDRLTVDISSDGDRIVLAISRTGVFLTPDAVRHLCDALDGWLQNRPKDSRASWEGSL